MASIAKPTERAAGDVRLLQVHCSDLDARSLEECVEISEIVGAEA